MLFNRYKGQLGAESAEFREQGKMGRCYRATEPRN